METLSKPQWLIMEVLWHQNPLFLSEIMEALQVKVDWSYTTCLTYLKKMIQQGYVTYKVVRGSRNYSPMVSREDCMVNESRSMLWRMAENSAVLFISNMIREGSLTRAERQTLRDLIDQLSEAETAEAEPERLTPLVLPAPGLVT